ncbi:putative pre-rRNA-processing protein TSR2 [Triangularia verruculosa]|uniref:Pre-rRNA-processing protein TSR2 n=1 Tax=Triangularia verruculosa TaxID=2587418 RepID=A0AAN6X7I8_9PEZI|nr:putative pre-rRNA-processing protein TSR2 [Triangularia verruculosa]
MESPSPAKIHTTFERAISLTLHLWPALTLAVQNNWGGPSSSDKRDWFAGAISTELFPDISHFSPAQLTTHLSSSSSSEPDAEYVEEFLLNVMLDEFEVNVDDDSAYEVAEQIIRLRKDCLKGKFDEVESLAKRYADKKGRKIVFQKGQDQEEEEEGEWDTDDDDDDEEGEEDDEDMADAPKLVADDAAMPRKEKQEPEVDEDGFQTVTRKKR